MVADKELSDRLVQLVVDSIKVLHDRMLAPEAESLLADAGRLSAEQASRCQNIVEELRSEAAKITKLKRCES